MNINFAGLFSQHSEMQRVIFAGQAVFLAALDSGLEQIFPLLIEAQWEILF